MYRILAIDDDRNMLKLLEKQIEVMGHKLVVGDSGQKGLEMAKTGNPDCILLDIIMPEMDGFDVLSKLRRDEVTKNTPIIMLTSRKDKKDVVKAMRYGVIDYIVKPYNYYNLSKKIELALKYGETLKTQAKTDAKENILITRGSGVTRISFKSGLSDKSIIDEVKATFSTSFLNMIKNNIIVLDLRSVPEIQDSDIQILNGIIELFDTDKLHIIAGKHYGDIVSMTDFEEQYHLFISLGDFEIFINKE